MKKLYTVILSLLLTVTISAQVEKKVIIEHFTNTKCSICASKNPAFYETIGNYPQVLHIAYHPSSPYSSCIFSQHNPIENDARTNFYGIYGGTPLAVIQGDVVPIHTPMVKTEEIEAHLGMTSDFKVTVSNNKVSDDNYKVTFEIERVSGNDGEEIDVYVGLAEEEVIYNAPNGEDLHHDVFRKVLFNESRDVNPVGNIKSFNVNYSMDPDWVADKMFSYIVIHKINSSEILQCESSLTSISAINTNSLNEVKNIFYPNPASTTLNIQAEYSNNIRKIELFSLVGNMVKEFFSYGKMDISDLPDGMYFAMITDKQNNQFSTRLIVRQ